MYIRGLYKTKSTLHLSKCEISSFSKNESWARNWKRERGGGSKYHFNGV